jgi:hypothetical protein
MMALKLKEEFGMTISMANLIKDYMVVALELSIFPSNVRKKIYDVLDGFI